MMKWACAITLVALAATGAARADEPKKSVSPVDRPDKWWKDRHESRLKMKAGGADVVFLGDSITQGWEGDGKEVWAAKIQPLKPLNLGFSGDRTQHVLWRITEGKELDGLTPRVAVIMIGTNNMGSDSAADIAAGVKAIVAELRKQKPEMKILLLGIFPRSADPKGQFRDKIKEVNADLAATKDPNVRFLDIGEKFLDAEGRIPKEIMPDQLHLSAKGYGIWAVAMLPALEELLKK
jgi:lysophospholipase L1-like esterase